MEKLKNVISKNGFTYKQVKRSERVAMYEQWDKDRIVCYEVFRIKTQKKRLWNGKQFPKKERFLRHSEFGYGAYAPRSLERAKEIYNQLRLSSVTGDVKEGEGLVLKLTNKAQIKRA